MPDKWILPAGTVLTLVAVVLLLAGANNNPQAQPALATKAELQDLESRLRILDARVDERFNSLSAQIKDIIDQRLPNYATQASLNDEIVRLRDDFSALGKRIDEFEGEVGLHGTILDAVTKLTTDGTYVPKILSNMNRDSEFLHEMEQAIGKSVAKESTVTIENRTQTSRTVYVNEDKPGYLLRPTETYTVKVSTGNVSTRIEGQELVNWSVGPPSYSLELAIEDRGPVVETYYYTPPPMIIYP